MNNLEAIAGRSYFDLFLQRILHVRLFGEVAIMADIVRIFYYSNSFGYAVHILARWGLSPCEIRWLLIPTAYWLLGILLIRYFLYRTAEYQPVPSDWRKLIEFVNTEEMLTDYFTGKKVPRNRRRFALKFGLLCVLGVMIMNGLSLAYVYSAKCGDVLASVRNYIIFVDFYSAMIFPSAAFFFWRMYSCREGKV